MALAKSDATITLRLDGYRFMAYPSFLKRWLAVSRRHHGKRMRALFW
ncbi:hypothetical protein TC41_1071 [Alicyclobacillus acidocaldarius subsp. acidocaldarius Tc-4-1]|uniref:Uncharacterized protein n=1 Tax=Alicyclobacillus acidocaldarius (strain Tc-4-1) TaxID=1048834 RepID=F8IGC6_ALIAT|nr:hypothetical protein TC41_1071 [Alicyclobacillus acidocaldarius subsp. acidocaldarius Tc-4-1]